MLPLLLLLVAAQVPAVPGESTLVSVCKQGRLTACQELAKTDPSAAAKIQADLAKATLGREALKVTEEGAREEGDAKAEESSEAEAETSGEPPNCNGQNHHIISRTIAKALATHQTLRGLFKPRDKRFVAKARDEESHCGYQDWHRKVDLEVVRWLTENPRATVAQFMRMLREIYGRPDMLKRFPNGF